MSYKQKLTSTSKVAVIDQPKAGALWATSEATLAESSGGDQSSPLLAAHPDKDFEKVAFGSHEDVLASVSVLGPASLLENPKMYNQGLQASVLRWDQNRTKLRQTFRWISDIQSTNSDVAQKAKDRATQLGHHGEVIEGMNPQLSQGELADRVRLQEALLEWNGTAHWILVDNQSRFISAMHEYFLKKEIPLRPGLSLFWLNAAAAVNEVAQLLIGTLYPSLEKQGVPSILSFTMTSLVNKFNSDIASQELVEGIEAVSISFLKSLKSFDELLWANLYNNQLLFLYHLNWLFVASANDIRNFRIPALPRRVGEPEVEQVTHALVDQILFQNPD